MQNSQILTPCGFNLTSVLKFILQDSYQSFKKNCKSFAGGATSFQDPTAGEQSIIYQYSSKGLSLSIKKASVVCWCTVKDELFCLCDERCESTYPDWDTYWNEHHEVLQLTEKQVQSYLSPDLFSI